MKITEEQLKKLQGLVSQINNVQMQVGAIEIQKHELNHQASNIQNDLKEYQKELEQEYGNISVNLQDGEITPSEEKDGD